MWWLSEEDDVLRGQVERECHAWLQERDDNPDDLNVVGALYGGPKVEDWGVFIHCISNCFFFPFKFRLLSLNSSLYIKERKGKHEKEKIITVLA